MTTPALTAATGPAALATSPAAGAAAPEGVFAGLLATAAPTATPTAAPTAAPTAGPAAPAAQSVDVAGLLGLLELPLEEQPEAVLPDGTLLGAQALGLVPMPLVLDVAVAPPAAGGVAVEASAPAAPAPVLTTAAPTAAPLADVATDEVVGTHAEAAAAAATGPAVVPAHATPATNPAAGVQDATPQPVAAPTATPAEPAPAAAAPVPAPPVAGPAEAGSSEAAVPAVPVEPAPAEPVVDEAVVAEAVTAQAAPVDVVAVPAGTAPAAAATAPAPLERLAAESGPEQVRPAVAELARGLRDAGGGRASLVVRLDPPELGPVLVRLTVQDGRVDVQLRTSESVAAVGLGQASADVRSTLLEHGLDLSSFDVASDADSSFSQHLSQGSPDRGTPGRRGGAENNEGATGATAPTGVITETTDDGAPAGAWL